MSRFGNSPGLLATLFTTLIAFLPLVASQDDVFNMRFTYGNFDGLIPDTQPTDAQLSALMCETQVWVAKILQDGTNSPTTTMKALDIGFELTDNPNATFIVTFTGDLRRADDGALPSNADLVAALDPETNPFINTTEYIENYVWAATPLDGSANYFRYVNQMDFAGQFGPAPPGTLAEADCPETIAPTNDPNATTSGATGDPFVNETDATGLDAGDSFGNETDPTAAGMGTDGSDPTENMPAGSDPNSACSVDGDDRFTCLVPNELQTSDGNVTLVNATVTCDLDSDIGLDIQQSENCECTALLLEQFGAGLERSCACVVCGSGSMTTIAVDCSQEENPFVFANCVGITCEGECDTSEGPAATGSSGGGSTPLEGDFTSDPNSACNADSDDKFTCLVPNQLQTSDGNVTLVNATVTCDFNPDIGLDIQESENCECTALLLEQFGAGLERNCSCTVCGGDSAQTISVDCSQEENPFVFASCVGITCEGQCDTTLPTAMDDTTTEAPEVPTAGGENVTDAMDDDELITGTDDLIGPEDGGTVAPTSGSSAPNTHDKASFQLEYGFNPDGEREPTEQEIIDLICITNLFFRDRIRNETRDNSVQSNQIYIDWTFVPGDEQALKVNFTSNTTAGDDGSVMDLETVFDIMSLSEQEIQAYITDYLWRFDQTHVLFEAKNVNFTQRANLPVPPGRLPFVECPETPAPTMMPTVSPRPTFTTQPSAPPSVSPAPTISANPTEAPVEKPLGAGGPDSGEGETTTPTISAAPTAPTISPMPTQSPEPTQGPESGGVGAFIPGEPSERVPITSQFMVSNIDGIARADEVNASGLAVSWPVFAEEVVADISADRANPTGSRMLRSHRRLAAILEPGSAYITNITRVSCPGEPGEAHQDAACHDTVGQYVLLVQNEDPVELGNLYKQKTDVAVTDGTYQTVLNREDPDTPLVIGVIPASTDRSTSDDDGGLPIWAIILIVLLCVLCCLCILCLLFYLMMQKKKDQDKTLEPYDEEGFVYDFLIPPHQKVQTEVDDDAETRGVDDEGEEFEDEPGDGAPEPVVMLPPEIENEPEEDLNDIDGDSDEDDQDDIDVEPRVVEEDDDDPNLVAVADDEEATPSDDEIDGDNEEPEGVRASKMDNKEPEEEEDGVRASAIESSDAEEADDDEDGWQDDDEDNKEGSDGADSDWEEDGAEADAGGEEEWDEGGATEENDGFEDADSSEEGWNDDK